MGFRAKAAKNCKESWGMGFLLVLFPEDSPNSTAINVDKPSSSKLFPSSSCSTSTSQMNANASIRRSYSNRLLTKAQSTISICALLVFVTLLLFTLSTFEPNNRTSPSNDNQFAINLASRRFLGQNRGRSLNSSSPGWSVSRMWKTRSSDSSSQKKKSSSKPQKALQGLGTLYRRGTKSMADLVVAHVKEDPNDDELRIFLRALHRSGLTSKSDVVLLFPSSSSQSKHDSLIHQENESFVKLVQSHRRHNQTSSSSSKGPSLAFDVTQFKPGKKAAGEAVWGKKGSSSFSGNESESESELARLSFGSVVGFEASELDPENSLSGFFTDLAAIPMSLRRWACYPMLLGRVRRNFKHVLLVDAKSVVVLGDQLGHVRNLSPESVHFYAKSESVSSKHGKRNSDKTQSLSTGVNSAVIAGGARGIRRLSAAMLTEIVRAATAAGQHKRKGPAVTDSGVLSQLVGNEFLLNDVRLVKTGDSVPEASELSRAKSKLSVVQCGNNGNGHEVIKSVIMKQICSNELDSSVYRDCQQKS